MGTDAESRERQKNHLMALLEIKAANAGKVEKLDEAVRRAIAPMNQEDIAWIEKITGVNALD